MSLSTSTETSRTLGVAKALVGHQIDVDAVYSKLVVLTGESRTLATKNGRWCFIDSLRLLSRVIGRLYVKLPSVSPQFEEDVKSLCGSLWSKNPIIFLNAEAEFNLTEAAAILNVGCLSPQGFPWTTINSNGWVAMVSSNADELVTDSMQSNPIAALMAASLGVSEVFKRIFEVPEERAPLFSSVQFSMFDLNIDSKDWGPELPEELVIPDTVLIGGGAIGNAIALVASQLPLIGRLHIVDKQDYAPENWETCSQTELEGWMGKPKAVKLATWLQDNSRLEVTGQKALIADAIGTEPIKSLSVDLVLNGLDDVQARHDAQMLWPAVIIDGGINEVGAAVVQHRLFRPDMACLICAFQLPEENVLEMKRKATGLAIASLENPDQDRAICEADVAQADADHQGWLREMVKAKRPLCSVIGDAMKALGVRANAEFKPSAPFVASASAALVMGEAIKAIHYAETHPVQRFIMADLFLGPGASIKLEQMPKPFCRCVVHKSLIEQSYRSRNKDGSKC